MTKLTKNIQKKAVKTSKSAGFGQWGACPSMHTEPLSWEELHKRLKAGIQMSFCIIFFLLLSNLSVTAATIKLAWDPVDDTSVIGYRIYQRAGSDSYDYSDPVWTGTETSWSFDHLSDDSIYYFVARSYTEANIESDNSNEVRFPQPDIDFGNTLGQTADSGCFIRLLGAH